MSWGHSKWLYEIKEQVEKEMKSILFMCRSKMNSACAKNEDTSMKILEANVSKEGFQSKKSEILEKLSSHGIKVD